MEISYDVKQMYFDYLIVIETWVTGDVWDQKIVGEVTPVGYSFHHAARIHKKYGWVSILLRDSLKCETHLRFQVKCFKITNWLLYLGG